jgi:hypothetical protein
MRTRWMSGTEEKLRSGISIELGEEARTTLR